MKRKLTGIILCSMILLLLFIIQIRNSTFYQGAISTSGKGVICEAKEIAKANVAKMVALLQYSEEDIEGLDRQIVYEDTDAEKWYDRYINALSVMGVDATNSGEKEFGPLDYITYSEVKELAKKLSIFCAPEAGQGDSETLYKDLERALSFSLEEKDGKKKVTAGEWLEIYSYISEHWYGRETEQSEIFLLGENTDTEEWKVATDQGTYTATGLLMEKYQNERIKVYLSGREILFVTGTSKKKTVLHNVWIVEGKEKSITFYAQGKESTIPVKKELAKNIKETIGDIKVVKGKVTKVSIKEDYVQEKVLSVQEDYIELEEKGRLDWTKDSQVYQVTKSIKQKTKEDILPGYQVTRFILEEGKVCAAIIEKSIGTNNIRVLLNNNDFSSPYHDEVQLTSQEEFTLRYGNKEKVCKAGQKVKLTEKSAMLKKGSVTIETKSQKGKIQILSLTRNDVHPSYRGKLEVYASGGKLAVVNELFLEEYLYAVIPSEMPSHYGEEAQKAQAICARSYAYKHLQAQADIGFQAHVDDSVDYQVYNNLPETDASMKAVDETYGQILKFDGEVASTYYYSTSCGHSSTADEVWKGGEKHPYLKGKYQIFADTVADKVLAALDLTVEENFRKFISNDLCKTYDSTTPWYRWSAKISEENMKNLIDNHLYEKYNANPDLILTKNEKGEFYSTPIGTLGEIKDIAVTGRVTGGLVNQVIITGSEETIQVNSEYLIRSVLAPRYDEIRRQDKSVVQHMTMLPSGFFFVDKKEKKGTNYFVFKGGGYGHGVGMSQTGAAAMEDSGKTYEDILNYYYEGCQIGTVY